LITRPIRLAFTRLVILPTPQCTRRILFFAAASRRPTTRGTLHLVGGGGG
jgi:hypothetical protein